MKIFSKSHFCLVQPKFDRNSSNWLKWQYWNLIELKGTAFGSDGKNELNLPHTRTHIRISEYSHRIWIGHIDFGCNFLMWDNKCVRVWNGWNNTYNKVSEWYVWNWRFFDAMHSCSSLTLSNALWISGQCGSR